MQDDKRTQRYRTTDVQSDAGSFNDLLLPQPLVSALASAGFQRPSPVQKAAIPIGRVGSDVIVQAKSGTGKTAVFATILLERVALDTSTPQALVLAPTRELAIQSYQVIQRIAAGLPDPQPSAAVFVGGLPTAEDEKRLRRTCHIVVGTPGRLCALVGSGALLLGKLAAAVLDEADQLLSENFYGDVAWLLQQLPSRKLVLAFSATFTAELLADLEPLMRRPQKVLLCEETVSLLGIRQYYKLVDLSSSSSSAVVPEAAAASAALVDAAVAAAAAADAAGSSVNDAVAAADGSGSQHSGDVVDAAAEPQQQQQQQQLSIKEQQQLLLLKVDALLQLLSTISFHQAVVFCNRKPAAEWLSRRLTAAGCPAAYLSADLPQEARMAAMEAVRGFRVRIIVSTDVMARGVDFDRVNLVVNLDLPPDAATYVHRVGRTGRFGSRGVAVALLNAAELDKLRGYLADVRGGDIAPLPASIPDDFYCFSLESEWEQQALQQLLAAPTSSPPASPPPLHRKPPQQQQRKAEDQGAEYEEWGEEEAEDAVADGGGGGGGDAADGDDAAAWDAWAEYYRSLGYSYPHENPYRQQHASSGSQQQWQQHQTEQQQQQQQQQWWPAVKAQQLHPWESFLLGRFMMADLPRVLLENYLMLAAALENQNLGRMQDMLQYQQKEFEPLLQQQAVDLAALQLMEERHLAQLGLPIGAVVKMKAALAAMR
ncbi:hypothetical protein OEZ86_002330 [Tetradesmus obliquus]|nr:hypothetical protein OEZ86_002330 [Tetradesmus obliquus]